MIEVTNVSSMYELNIPNKNINIVIDIGNVDQTVPYEFSIVNKTNNTNLMIEIKQSVNIFNILQSSIIILPLELKKIQLQLNAGISPYLTFNTDTTKFLSLTITPINVNGPIYIN